MSESSFHSQPVESVALDDSTGGKSRRPLVLGGALGAVVLAAGGWFLLGSGETDDVDLAVPARQPAAAAPAEATPAPVEVVPAASTDAIGRNPFKVLYTEPAAAGGAPAPSGGTAPVTTPAIIELSKPAPAPAAVVTTAPTTPTSTASPTATAKPTPAPSPTATPSPLPSDDGVRYPVTLLDINVSLVDDPAKYVSWGYGGESFVVEPGQPFGRFKHLRVMQVLDTTVSGEVRKGVMLQMGDGAPYFVAVGETVYVL